jgi:hypothetical protein
MATPRAAPGQLAAYNALSRKIVASQKSWLRQVEPSRSDTANSETQPCVWKPCIIGASFDVPVPLLNQQLTTITSRQFQHRRASPPHFIIIINAWISSSVGGRSRYSLRASL